MKLVSSLPNSPLPLLSSPLYSSPFFSSPLYSALLASLNFMTPLIPSPLLTSCSLSFLWSTLSFSYPLHPRSRAIVFHLISSDLLPPHLSSSSISSFHTFSYSLLLFPALPNLHFIFVIPSLMVCPCSVFRASVIHQEFSCCPGFTHIIHPAQEQLMFLMHFLP